MITGLAKINKLLLVVSVNKIQPQERDLIVIRKVVEELLSITLFPVT